jgi:hypothetical protein
LASARWHGEPIQYPTASQGSLAFLALTAAELLPNRADQ